MKTIDIKLVVILFVMLVSFLAFSFANNRGQAIYKQACQTCHNPNTAPLMNSPIVHDVKAWKFRLESAEELAKKDPAKYKNGMAVLVQTVKKGKGAMVPGGMCQDATTPDKQCTEADYTAAIEFMMSPEK